MNFLKFISLLPIIFIINSCGLMMPKWKSINLTEQDMRTIKLLTIESNTLKKLIDKPLFKFSEQELDMYLGYLQFVEPDLRGRVQHLARKCLRQPYEIYLLGEFPVELYDKAPLYSIKKSDCVVFAEHIYAMALSYDWESFFAMLQRIRYKNGEISIITRNHYTEYDWDINNSWLVQDITEELAGENAEMVTSVIDKAKFFKKWDIGKAIPPDTLHWSYIPYQLVPEIINQLQPGDFVNVVRGNDSSKYVGHVGLISKNADSTINFLHSTRPKVKEELLLNYLESNLKWNKEKEIKNRKIEAYNEKLKKKKSNKSFKQPLPYFYGFKFLRLREDPLWELVKIDGIYAPKVTIPSIY